MLLLAMLLLVQAAAPNGVDISELQRPEPERRIAALVSWRSLKGEHRELLEPAASALQDGQPDVRTAAAYTLAQLAVRLGCDPEKAFARCEVFRPLFDTTPMREGTLQIRYPEAPLQARQQGSVAVQYLVGEDGKVRELAVIGGAPAFAVPVADQLRNQLFKPAIRNGQPVPFVIVMSVRFRLR